ncbi:hypothetical protein [Bradyrhizobium sp. SK17]|jgi:hypothetical protein|uniref:hypothetical protein n=1 Tax=Bradyrhizobium sp. SK17 TaxID=2057741 RepID=UPI0012FD555A|nr:hypothetical protein [Bradyrhizobium sp. SK17]
MSDVIEVSMTETDHAHGKEIMGQVCDQHGSDKKFPDQVPQPDRETLNRWLYCVVATGESGDDATRGKDERCRTGHETRPRA